MSKKNEGLSTAVGLLGVAAAVGGLVWLFSDPPESSARQRLKQRMLAALHKAAAAIGVKAPTLTQCNRRGTNAWSDGYRIGWNPVFFEEVLARHCTDDACQESVLVGIMGHELAHHVKRHAVRTDLHPHVQELDADGLAGHILATVGVQPHHFENVIAEISQRPTASHPGAFQRVAAIRRGWQRARGWFA